MFFSYKRKIFVFSLFKHCLATFVFAITVRSLDYVFSKIIKLRNRIAKVRLLLSGKIDAHHILELLYINDSKTNGTNIACQQTQEFGACLVHLIVCAFY